MPRLAPLALIALAAGCGLRPDPEIHVTVTDWWENPIEGAQVTGEGLEPITTGADGKFTLPMKDAWAFRVEGPGVLPRDVDLIPARTTADHRERVETVPVPPGPGAHLVGPDRYVTVVAQPVLRVGDETRAWHGVRAMGAAVISGDVLQLVWHGPLKLDEPGRLDLELHRLVLADDLRSAPVIAASGSTTGSAPAQEAAPAAAPTPNEGLWVSAGKLEFRKKQFLDQASWGIRVDDIAPGAYALVSTGLLDATGGAWAAAPETVRAIYPFRVE